MNILLLEPFYGGSHKSWAEGFSKHSVHNIEVLDLPANRWRWRLRAGAMQLAETFNSSKSKPDLILSSDMLDLSLFLALTRKTSASTPTAVYFHENQLCYPLSPRESANREKQDLHFGFINISSALAADKVFFNSDFHRRAFLKSLHTYLSRQPNSGADRVKAEVKRKSSVLHVGMDYSFFEKNNIPKKIPRSIVWNHRWEYDKNPEAFFNTLYSLDERDIDFSLIVLGEPQGAGSDLFDRAKQKLEHRILHWGYVKNKKDYCSWLQKASIQFVTSKQEFFGISVCEAMFAGCTPLLPKRLSYPELIPRELHQRVFYSNKDEMIRKLEELLGAERDLSLELQLRKRAEEFRWTELISQYDSAMSGAS